MLLWLLEVFAAVLCCAYLWEICDALGTEHWQRRITPATPLSVPDSELPMLILGAGSIAHFVAFQPSASVTSTPLIS